MTVFWKHPIHAGEDTWQTAACDYGSERQTRLRCQTQVSWLCLLKRPKVYFIKHSELFNQKRAPECQDTSLIA